MDEQKFSDMMASDQKLWSAASGQLNADGSITKSIEVPWGIGVVNIRMPFNDANDKRNAFSAFGANIRSIIENHKSDEAVSARVAAKARKVEPVDSERSGSEHPAGN